MKRRQLRKRSLFHDGVSPREPHGRSIMPKGQVPWASDDQRLAGGFGSMLDFFTPPPKPPQVGRPAGVPAKKRGRPPAAPVSRCHQRSSSSLIPRPSTS
jgi:hypothetical protein